jgi:hypothetical protein
VAIDRNRLQAAVLYDDVGMVVEMSSDTREVEDRLDSQAA